MLFRMVHWLLMNPKTNGAIYIPTAEGVNNLSKIRLAPLLNSIKETKGSNDDDKLSLRKVGESNFFLFHIGGTLAKDSQPIDHLMVDEVRLCDPKDVDQVQERISHSKHKIKCFMSTCFAGNTEIIVRNKHSLLVTKKTIKELESCFEDYEALSYNRLGGYRARWRNIKGVINNGIKDMIQFTTDGGHVVKCTPDHRFAIHAPGRPIFGEGSFEEIQNVPLYPKGGHKERATTLFSLLSIPTTDVESSYDLLTFEFFGLYIAEGTCSKYGELQIWQNNKNKKNEAARSIARSWAEAQGLPYRENDDGVFIQAKSRPEFVKVARECGGHASTKRIPEILLSGSQAQVKHLIHGFILGDGHICNYSNPAISSREFDLYTTSPQLASDLLFVLQKTGTPGAIHIRDRSGTPVIINGVQTGTARHPEHRITMNPGSHRHYEKLKDVGGLELRKVEASSPEEAYDLSIENDHWFFLAGSGLLAHNCGLPNDSIDLRYQYGTQHSWHSNCGCPDGCNLALTFPHCIVADDPKRPGEVYYRCPTCKWRIKNPQNGRYIAHNPGADYNSYHVSQLVSAYQTPKEIWTFYNRTTNMAEFYNAKLGLPYIDAENQGVSMSQLEGCVNPDLPWPEKEKTYTAMGIDQGGGYCYVIIADYNEDRTKKRIRHLEVIEQNNPAYMTEGQQVSPFERCAELMEQYKVRICVCDSMPNYNEALRFANKFLGRVFLAYYSHEAKETVLWGDKAKTKATLIKAGPLLKFKYTAQLGRFPSLSMSLSEWADGNVAIPHPDRAVQMMRDEKTNQLAPEAPARRLFRHLACMIRRYNETDPETGRGRWEWIHTGPDHFAHAWNYCNVALERLNRGSYMGFM